MLLIRVRFCCSAFVCFNEVLFHAIFSSCLYCSVLICLLLIFLNSLFFPYISPSPLTPSPFHPHSFSTPLTCPHHYPLIHFPDLQFFSLHFLTKYLPLQVNYATSSMKENYWQSWIADSSWSSMVHNTHTHTHTHTHNHQTYSNIFIWIKWTMLSLLSSRKDREEKWIEMKIASVKSFIPVHL